MAKEFKREVGSDEAQVNAVIEDLRRMRGLKRIDELGDRPDGA